MSEPRSQILAEAGRAFGAALDPTTAPWNVVRFLVPRLADWSLVGRRNTDGYIECVAYAHVDPTCSARLAQLDRITPGHADALARVLRSGRPFVARDVAQRPDLLPVSLDDLDTRALLVVPLGAHRRPAGVIVQGAATPERFGLADARLSVALALRASIVFDLARRYDAMRERSASLSNIPKARRKQHLLDARAHRRAELVRQWLGRP
ncbi:MAG TPA: GAF domain-containing protein [Chloroflexota bacterium]|nr:GAF domain-containing protein [Chloroflexota bacterium]